LEKNFAVLERSDLFQSTSGIIVNDLFQVHVCFYNDYLWKAKKQSMKKSILFAISAMLLNVPVWGQRSKTQSFTKSFISEIGNEGIITNSKPRVLTPYYAGGQGKEITIGWDAQGNAMRGFLSFDVSGIKPKPGDVLVIDRAVLKVYEANTNMHPFNGDGVRTVECNLVDYQELDISDFDQQAVDACGTIAVTGYSVLTEHPLVVTSKVSARLLAKPSASKIQFRLQFTSDDNLADGSPLKQSMWNIFAGEETSKAAYRPVLQIKYHYNKIGQSSITQ
jgi:hypothetical protein